MQFWSTGFDAHWMEGRVLAPLSERSVATVLTCVAVDVEPAEQNCRISENVERPGFGTVMYETVLT